VSATAPSARRTDDRRTAGAGFGRMAPWPLVAAERAFRRAARRPAPAGAGKSSPSSSSSSSSVVDRSHRGARRWTRRVLRAAGVRVRGMFVF